MAYQAQHTMDEGVRRVDEIHSHRSGRSIWPLILSVLALAIALWALLQNRSVDTDSLQTAPSTTSSERSTSTPSTDTPSSGTR